MNLKRGSQVDDINDKATVYAFLTIGISVFFFWSSATALYMHDVSIFMDGLFMFAGWFIGSETCRVYKEEGEKKNRYELRKKVEALKPILYSEDVKKHKENVLVYNTLDKVLNILK